MKVFFIANYMYKLNNAKGLFIIWSVKLVIFWRDSSMHASD